MTTTKANTMPVVCSVSLRVGQTTFFVSATDSWAKTWNCLPGADVQNTAAAAARPASTAATRTIIGRWSRSSRSPPTPAATSNTAAAILILSAIYHSEC